ncbi:MAG TPA: SDR family NAD(P)-dependent oxidoreductase [Candidatus Binatus sp.]|jgi:NAD(P)-dependent dehydrogenase (short-subunit alcohol dehydrogenase family)|nr:SDR family NAD(P)-dependent oxidoreductase [Candidatus Binatus sp.]
MANGMLADRVAVVTGAGRGIGRGVALALAAAGAKVVVNDFGVNVDGTAPSSGPAFDVVREIERAGGQAVASPESVADWEGARRIIGTAIERYGQLDVLVTCAGILRDRMVFNMSEEEWDAVMAVHLKGTFNCLRHACTHMRDRRYGRIITFSSGSGLFGNPGQANYGAAKSAIGGLTKVAARDLGKYGITVNAIAPVAGTRMTVNDEVRRARELRKQQGIQREDRGVAQIEELDPDDVAPMVVYLASEYAKDVNGQFFLCFGNSVALVSQPRPVKTLYKPEGNWTLDELDRLVPVTVAEGLVNPAPAKG